MSQKSEEYLLENCRGDSSEPYHIAHVLRVHPCLSLRYALRSSMLKSLRSRSPMMPKAARFLSMWEIIM